MTFYHWPGKTSVTDTLSVSENDAMSYNWEHTSKKENKPSFSHVCIMKVWDISELINSPAHDSRTD